MRPDLYFVIPCYNEEAVLPASASAVLTKLNDLKSSGIIDENSRIMFVDDGSSDSTWEIIESLHRTTPCFTGIKLSHNCGEQNANLAGLTASVKAADVMITIDCDLQDDIDAADAMLARFSEGNEIVYGVRRDRSNDPWLQRKTSSLFYSLMRFLGTELIPEHSQFRLMSRRAVEFLLCYGEVNLFLPALVRKIGLKYDVVEYERKPRTAGKSKYSYLKLIRLAISAIVSFSSAPLTLATTFACLSGILFLISLFCFGFGTASHGEFSVPWAIMASVWLISALLFIMLRIIGEYIFQILAESKRRPRFQVEISLLEQTEQTE